MKYFSLIINERWGKKKKVLQDGDTEVLADQNLLIIKREVPKSAQLFSVLKFGSSDQEITLSDYFTIIKRLVSASIVSDNSGIRQG